MPFETITDPEHINTHRLSVERPERTEKLFDPKREITPEDWEGMKTRLERSRNSDWYGFADLADNMSELDSEKVKPLITPEDWEGMKSRLEGWRNSSWYGFAELASNMSSLDSEKVKPLISSESWEGMKTQLEGWRNRDWYGFAFLAANMSELSTLFDKPKKLKDTTPPLPEVREF